MLLVLEIVVQQTPAGDIEHTKKKDKYLTKKTVPDFMVVKLNGTLEMSWLQDKFRMSYDQKSLNIYKRIRIANIYQENIAIMPIYYFNFKLADIENNWHKNLTLSYGDANVSYYMSKNEIKQADLIALLNF